MIGVRFMEKEDCSTVAAIEKEIFSCPWSEQSFLDTLEKKDIFYLVAEKKTGRENMLIGYIGIWQSFEEADITLLWCWRKEKRE